MNHDRIDLIIGQEYGLDDLQEPYVIVAAHHRYNADEETDYRQTDDDQNLAILELVIRVIPFNL